MFDFDATKFLIVGAAALIFIPPKDLPRVMRQAGQFVGKMKRMASEFQGQFMDAMREADMADLRREAQELSRSTRVDLGLDQLNTRMHGAIGSKPVLPGPQQPNPSIAAAAVQDAAPVAPSADPSPVERSDADAVVGSPGGEASASSHTVARHETVAEPATHPV